VPNSIPSPVTVLLTLFAGFFWGIFQWAFSLFLLKDYTFGQSSMYFVTRYFKFPCRT
jgi:hypothetical protein